MEKQIIAVFGGSFNPPTVAHINLAKQILNKIQNIEKVIFVPVSTKYNKGGLASNEIRFGMLRKICEKEEKLEVSSIELDTSKQLYTIETLRLIQEQNKKSDILFVIGTDNLKEIETWHKAEELLKNFKVLILERGNDNIEEIIENDSFLKKHKQSFIKLQNIDKINLSATEIRKNVKNGESIKGLVPEEIINDVISIYNK